MYLSALDFDKEKLCQLLLYLQLGLLVYWHRCTSQNAIKSIFIT